jgi:hypothetical protein
MATVLTGEQRLVKIWGEEETRCGTRSSVARAGDEAPANGKARRQGGRWSPALILVASCWALTPRCVGKRRGGAWGSGEIGGCQHETTTVG